MIVCDACAGFGTKCMGERRDILDHDVDLCETHWQRLYDALHIVIARFSSHNGKMLSDQDCRLIAERVTPLPRAPSP